MIVLMLIGLLALGFTYRRISQTENSRIDKIYACAFSVLIASIFLFASSRPATSCLATLFVVWFIGAASEMKHRYMSINLHALDVGYFFSSPAAIVFWLKTLDGTQKKRLTQIGLSLIALAAVVVVEPNGIMHRWSGALVLVAFAAVLMIRRFLQPWTYFDQFDRPIHLAHFFETIFHALQSGWRGGVIASSASEMTAPSPERAPDAAEAEHPTIILILNESTFPPALYDRDDENVSHFFQSANGRKFGMRVEIFGGASWRTDFSVLTGIPSSSYGAFATQVFRWAAGRIHHSLPQSLKNLGYKTAMIYPSAKEFLGVEKFYRSIAIDEIQDRNFFGSNIDREPDSVYFDRTIAWLKAHFAKDDAPCFVYTLTMSNHFPHDLELIEENQFIRCVPLSDTEMDEYVRRLQRTTQDYAAFKAQLAENFPGKPFLLAHFGDHQPPFTMQYFGKKRWRGEADEVSPQNERAFSTYFAIDGVNFDPHLDQDLPDTIESAYLGTLILAAAKIPPDPVNALRLDLLKTHKGLLYFAEKEGLLAARVNGYLLENGLISPH